MAFDSLPDPSLPPAMAREQSVGHPSNHNTALRCFMSAQERWTGLSALDSVVPVHPSRCSPFHRPSRCTQHIHERLLQIEFIHRHVLQPFALPRRGMAFTSWRAIHACRNLDRINSATFNSPRRSCFVEQPHLPNAFHITHVRSATSIAIITCDNVQNSPSSPSIRASTTLRRLLSRSSPGAVCTGLA